MRIAGVSYDVEAGVCCECNCESYTPVYRDKRLTVICNTLSDTNA